MKNYAILFPGQGSQYVGMGKKLYEQYDIVKKIYDEANAILEYNIRDLCFNGKLCELTSTSNAQPAIVLAGVAAYKVFCEKVGYEPKYIAGHSIGEITALTCAGVINFEDALKIAYKRGILMENANPGAEGAMCAILGCEITEVERICANLSVGSHYIAVSNYNTYDQVVISGNRETVTIAVERLNALGAKCIMLNVSGAFHSQFMHPIVDEFKETLTMYQFNDFNTQVVSSVDGLPYAKNKLICEKLAEQIVSPVQWIKTMEFLKGSNVNCVVDLGPGNVVYNLANKCNSEMKVFSFEKEEDKAVQYLKEVPQKAYDRIIEYNHTVVTKCIAITVCTKNENLDSTEYENGVLKPYRKMQEMQAKIENENRRPSDNECIEALNLLKKIFKTKKTSMYEQKVRFKEICNVVDVSEYVKEATSLVEYIVD